MINITRTHNSISIKGHAGYAPVGQDLVCASVSILYYTLAECLEPLGAQIKEEAGDCFVLCNNEKARHVFETIMVGFRLLEDNYPNCVKIDELES